MKRILCDANPMCYGSSSALLSITDHLHAHLTAIAQGVTAELLSRDPRIQHVEPIDPKDAQAVAHYLRRASFDAVLVVSNQNNIPCYAAAGLPIFFVDILYWYSAHKDQDVWAAATQTFVQNFPGVPERLQEQRHPGPPPCLVGPLIRPASQASGDQGGTLVNLGGGRSRWIEPGVNTSYPSVIAQLLDALGDDLPEPLLVAGGAQIIRELQRHLQRPARCESLPQREFIQALAGCQRYLTAPGLNAVFEGMQARKTVSFLPPQNASQIFQLTRYEDAGLLPKGLNLPELQPLASFPALDRVQDERAVTELVLKALRALDQDPPAMQRLVQHTRAQLHQAHEAREAQERFLAALGPLGGPTIARHMEEHLADQP